MGVADRVAAGHVAADRVAAVRAFTRSYTAALGILDKGLLQTPYGVTEARVLYELAQQPALDTADLRARLGLDAGYLSRILRRFEAGGLVSRGRSARDGRRQVLALTDSGRGWAATLDRRSCEQVGELLAGLTDADQVRLVAAMDAVRGLLTGPAERPRTVLLRPPAAGDLGWVVARHGAVYADEYGWDATFEGLVATIVGAYARGHDPAREAAWIAEVDGDPAGCVFCVAGDGDGDARDARLRLLLVDPAARGLGIGSRLVAECVRFARRAGYATLTLWTNDVLVAARRIYVAAGFRLVHEEEHRSFGHDLRGQTWRLAL